MACDVHAFLVEFDTQARARGLVGRALCETAAGPLMVWEPRGAGAAGYLSAGIHGDEPAGPLAALELLKCGAFDDGGWRLCPVLNPCGLATGSRDNAEGLDLNRDYLSRRSPEVRAHAAWLESVSCPSLFLSLHEDWEYSGFYMYEINLGEDCPQRAARILDEVAERLPVETAAVIDDHVVRAPGWIYHAAEADLPEQWPEAIFLAKRGCPLSFTYETPSSLRLESRIAAHAAAVQAALATCGGGGVRGGD